MIEILCEEQIDTICRRVSVMLRPDNHEVLSLTVASDTDEQEARAVYFAILKMRTVKSVAMKRDQAGYQYTVQSEDILNDTTRWKNHVDDVRTHAIGALM